MTDFNGVTLTVTLDPPTNGVLNLDVREVLYEGWKDWLLGDNSNLGFPQLFRPIGGDSLTSSLDAGAYFFIRNDLGWRIISTDEDQEINYIGNIVPQDSSLPLIINTPGRTVLHLGLQDITQGLSGIEAAVWGHTIENGLSAEQLLRLVTAMSAGDIVQQTDGSYVIKSLDGLTDRIDGQGAANSGRTINNVNP